MSLEEINPHISLSVLANVKKKTAKMVIYGSFKL